MAEFLQRLKRKTRSSGSSGSDEGFKSPEGKKICESNNEAGQSRETAILRKESDENDEVLVALEMSEQIAGQLQLILKKLDKVESKLEDVATAVAKLEITVGKVQREVSNLEIKTTKLEKSAVEMDKGLEFLNAEVQELKNKEKERLQEVESLKNQILYQEVYNRRENLRFIGIKEAGPNEEDTREVVHEFLEKELGIDDSRRIEFQRIHRVGRKTEGQTRPIIAKFLIFGDRELVYTKAVTTRERREVKVLVDLPKEIRERRKQQWPKLNQARREESEPISAGPNPTSYLSMAFWYQCDCAAFA